MTNQLFPLRPLQQAAMDQLKSSLRAGKRRIVLQAATGFGKTILGAHMAAGALEKGNRCAFVVPQLSLIDQTFTRFVENGISPGDMGVMQADHPWRRPAAPLQICSVQTVDRRGFPEVKFVIVDEAHIRFKAIDRWVATRPDVLFFGLSATPWSRGMGEIWDDLIVPTTLADLIAAGDLCKFRVFAAAKPDLSGVRTVAGEYHEGELSSLMSGKEIVADVVTTWLEKAAGLPTLLFAVDRAHAATLHEQFNEAGVPSAYVDGETPREERLDVLKRYAAGEFKIICSVATMITGIDVTCRCIVDAAPTKSEIRHVQKIGRGLRNESGKESCLILDHAGNCLRLGLPTEIGRTTLRTGKSDEAEAREGKQKSEPLPRECAGCGNVIPARVRVCDGCGLEAKRQSDVRTVDGELVELGTPAAPKAKATPAIERLRTQGKQAVFSQLWGVATRSGKSEKFVLAKYKAIFGVWPRGLSPLAASPSPELSSWLHAERIKWAKSQDAKKRVATATAEDGKALADAA